MINNQGDLTGHTLGACILEKHIGQGGMGTVYLARQTRPARKVAVKVLLPNLAMNSQVYQEFLARFRREADVVAKLEHVNIVPIYEYGEQGGLAYLVMPYLTGGSLRDVLARKGALTLQEAVTYTDQAASALDYAHAQGVIHRDLKPANFLLHADGRLVLADFGIARIMQEGLTGATLTSPGSMLGTPEYMAPEMAQGQTVDYRADIYELGIVLFQMLSGHVPFTGNTPYAVMIRHVQEPLQLLSQINPAIPPVVDAVIQKAAAKQPGDRYQTGREMAQALRNAASMTIVSPKDNEEHVSTILSPSSSLGLPVATPQYETPPAQRQLSDARLSNSQWPNVGPPPPPPSADTPVYGPPSYPAYQTPANMPPTIQMRRQPLVLLFIAILLVIALVIGGVFVGIQISRGTQGISPAPTVAPTTQPSAATATTPPQATTLPTPIATAAYTTIPLGTQIYKAISPGANCDKGGGQWEPYSGAQVSCLGNKTRVTNESQTGELDGIFLTRLPGQNYPANYVVQAQFQQDTTSSSDFGIYFRNQPGQQRGVYTFLIHADGSWSAYVYDNTTGAETEIAKGAILGDSHALITMKVVVSDSQFSFYVNGRAVGSVSDQTYPSGTVGIAVDRGGSVVVSNFALYTTNATRGDGY
jgi:serine/threonine protein kinase